MQLSKYLVAFFASIFLMVAYADQNAPVQSTMEAYLVEYDHDGNEVLTEASSAEPGQIIEWKITFRNVTADTQSNLVVSGPVSQGTEYVADSAKSEVPSNLVVSIDNGRTYQPEPVMRDRVLENGKVVQELVPAKEYTHVRWKSQEPLLGYASQVFTYRVRVE